MKNKVKLLLIGCIAIVFLLPISCVNNLLDQQSTADLDAGAFWKSEDDALYALYGAYASVRPCCDRSDQHAQLCHQYDKRTWYVGRNPG